MPGYRNPRLLAVLTAVACAWIPGSAGPATASASSPAPSAQAAGRKQDEARRKKRARARSQQRRAALRKELLRQLRRTPTLMLDPRFRAKLQGTGATPMTLRLRRPNEGGPGADAVDLSWDTAAVPWPLAGTEPYLTPAAGSEPASNTVTTTLAGTSTAEPDFWADTRGYGQAGNTETRFGAGTSFTATGFPIAQHLDPACASPIALRAVALTITSAGARIGVLNPFAQTLSGTLDLRTSLLSRRFNCDGSLPTPDTAIASTGPADRPIPVPFDATLRVSPGITADGRLRFGTVEIVPGATVQRSAFGLVYACTDPAAGDGCARRAFPMRARIRSMAAELLVGDNMQAAPGPPVDPDPPPPPAAPAPEPAPEPAPAPADPGASPTP